MANIKFYSGIDVPSIKFDKIIVTENNIDKVKNALLYKHLFMFHRNLTDINYCVYTEIISNRKEHYDVEDLFKFMGEHSVEVPHTYFSEEYNLSHFYPASGGYSTADGNRRIVLAFAYVTEEYSRSDVPYIVSANFSSTQEKQPIITSEKTSNFIVYEKITPIYEQDA